MLHQPEKWLEDYNRTGYLVVEDVVDKQTLAMLDSELESIRKNLDTLPEQLRKHVQLERDYLRASPDSAEYQDLTEDMLGDAIRNTMELPKFSKNLAEFICYEPLLDVLETVFGSSEFHFHNYKCITKAPRVSSRFRWHRDLPYLQHSTSNLITAMICVDPMTKANGATVVLPGTHRIPDSEVKREDMNIREEDLPKDAEHVTVECPAGSAVLFHVNLIHGGGANRSEMPRRNVIGIWAGPDTYPTTAARYVYQGLYPRSKDAARQKQTQMTFPNLFAEQAV